MKKIAIFGKKGSGKSTVAEMLDVLWRFKRLPLAYRIKKMLLTLPDIEHEHVWGDRKEEIIPLYERSARQMMQTLGTEWRDTVNPYMWLRLWKRDADVAELDGFNGVTVDDGRFRFELDFLRGVGCTIVGIDRPEANNVEDSHASEAFPFEAHDFDVIINNDGDLPALRDQVHAVYNNL